MSDRQDPSLGDANPTHSPENETSAMRVEAASAAIDAAVETLKSEPQTDVADAQPADVPQGDLFDAPDDSAIRMPEPEIAIAATPIAVSPRSEPPRTGRFLLLAALVALAGGIGAMIGTLGASGLTTLAHAIPGIAPSAQAGTGPGTAAAEFSQMASELKALKTSIKRTNRNTSVQFTKLSRRMDKLERQTAARTAKLAKAIDIFKQREPIASPQPTLPNTLPKTKAAAPNSSANVKLAAAPIAAMSAAPQTTGSIAAVPLPRPKAPQPPAFRDSKSKRIVRGWRVRDVFDGMALIQGRMGLIEVAPGDILPDLGEIRAVERRRGRWVVVTSRGIIRSR